MSENKYVIRYRLDGVTQWCYSSKIEDTSTYSISQKDSSAVTKMTLEEARKNAKKIIKVREGRTYNIINTIQIIDTETNEIINDKWKYEETSRFELMDI